MSHSLSNLRSSNATEKLAKQIADANNKFKKDERYWELTVDKAGNGFAIIRFLMSPYVDGPDAPSFVQLWTHGFKGPSGTWYIENSLTTLGQDDPVSEYNAKLWATGLEANKKIASAQKRQLRYISNILVIKDPAKPENEGKVFLYSYGKEIFDHVDARIPREGKTNVDPDFKFFNPYHFWEGADFKLKARKKDSGYRTYDKSEFVAPAPIGTDAEIEKIWKSMYSLAAEIAPDKFKTYAQLKSRLDKVLGHTESAASSATQSAEAAMAAEVAEATSGGSDDDSELDVFRRLASED